MMTLEPLHKEIYFDFASRFFKGKKGSIEEDVLPVTFAFPDQSRDLRCSLAKEARCQRYALHAETQTETRRRATFRSENRV